MQPFTMEIKLHWIPGSLMDKIYLNNGANQTKRWYQTVNIYYITIENTNWSRKTFVKLKNKNKKNGNKQGKTKERKET